MRNSSERIINANVDEVLDTLRKNLTEHQKMVAEAQAGYLTEAAELLRQRLAQIEAGEPVPLNFDLPQPRDYTKEFTTIITMLELHKRAHDELQPGTPATITLNTQEVRQFVMNDWWWEEDFLRTNSFYSPELKMSFLEKGYR